jgi:hypothetical protein
MAMWVVPAILGVLGVLIFIGGMRVIGKGRALSGGFGALTGGGLMALGAATSLMSLNLQTYQALSYEQQVAEVHIQQKGDQLFDVRVIRPGQAEKTFTVHGDEFRMEARVLKFKPWANVVGLNAMYRLDRLSGRYISIDQEKTSPRTVEGFIAPGGEPGLDLHAMALKYGKSLPVVDATYGSGTYAPMADKAIYTVTMSQSGLLSRAANDEARTATAVWAQPQPAMSAPDGTGAPAQPTPPPSTSGKQ